MSTTLTIRQSKYENVMKQTRESHVQSYESASEENYNYLNSDGGSTQNAGKRRVL